MLDYIREYLYHVSCKYIDCINVGDIEQAKQHYQFIGGFLCACLATEDITPTEYLNILFLYTHPDLK